MNHNHISISNKDEPDIMSSLDSIRLPESQKKRGRGRPKGSKSRSKYRKRPLMNCLDSNTYTGDIHYNQIASYQLYPSSNTTNNQQQPIDEPPRRKKRKPNKTHQEKYPQHTDEQIREQLAMERKAKNRKSAQESRERRKAQEKYLNDRLPKGLELKEQLKQQITNKVCFLFVMFILQTMGSLIITTICSICTN